MSRPTLEMPAERQPKGPVEEAGAGHIECEKCGLALILADAKAGSAVAA